MTRHRDTLAADLAGVRTILVTALSAEARPLAEAGNLLPVRPQQGLPFALYRNEHLALVRCGVGSAAAATATGWVAGFAGAAMTATTSTNGTTASSGLPSSIKPGSRCHLAWLNVGVAGGRWLRPGVKATYGELAWAASVVPLASRSDERPPSMVDSAKNQPNHQPARRPAPLFAPWPGPLPASAAIVRTVDHVERDYHLAGLFEMEAAGFVAAGRQFSTAELVHCLKVVSDTPEYPVEQLHRDLIEELVARHSRSILNAAEWLASCVGELADDRGVSAWLIECREDTHFTVSQLRQLRRLGDRWRALRFGDLPTPGKTTARGRGAAFLEEVATALTAGHTGRGALDVAGRPVAETGAGSAAGTTSSNPSPSPR